MISQKDEQDVATDKEGVQHSEGIYFLKKLNHLFLGFEGFLFTKPSYLIYFLSIYILELLMTDLF